MREKMETLEDIKLLVFDFDRAAMNEMFRQMPNLKKFYFIPERNQPEVLCREIENDQIVSYSLASLKQLETLTLHEPWLTEKVLLEVQEIGMKNVFSVNDQGVLTEFSVQDALEAFEMATTDNAAPIDEN